MALRVLMYWEGDASQVSEAIEDWAKSGVTIEMFGRRGVEALLRLHYPAEWLDLFARIRIPACRSDVARWLLLDEYGGLYVDAHSAPPENAAALDQCDRLLCEAHVVLFEHVEREAGANNLCLSVVAARRRTVDGRRFIDAMFESLAEHDAAESLTTAHVPYDIYGLTGGDRVFEHFYDTTKDGIAAVKPQFVPRVSAELTVDDPVRQVARLYQHYGYREPGRHWSERQESEPLLERPSA